MHRFIFTKVTSYKIHILATLATAIAFRRLEIEAEAKAEAEGGTSNFVSSIWYDVKAILVITMTSVVEYQSINIGYTK